MAYSYHSMPIPVGKYNLKGVNPMKPTLWVIHNTSNNAAAWNEASYMTNNGNVEAFHYVVDEEEIYQTLSTEMTCNHAPGWNHCGIGIEIARSSLGANSWQYKAAEKNAIDFIARDMIKRGWNPYDNLGFHRHASHSNTACPQNIPVSREAEFRKAIADKMNEIKGVSKPSTPPSTSKPKPQPAKPSKYKGQVAVFRSPSVTVYDYNKGTPIDVITPEHFENKLSYPIMNAFANGDIAIETESHGLVRVPVSSASQIITPNKVSVKGEDVTVYDYYSGKAVGVIEPSTYPNQTLEYDCTLAPNGDYIIWSTYYGKYVRINQHTIYDTWAE